MSMEEFGVSAENERGCCSSLPMRCKPSIEELITVSSCLNVVTAILCIRFCLQYYNYITITQIDPIEHYNIDFDVINLDRYL
jgi:hypothetical protein